MRLHQLFSALALAVPLVLPLSPVDAMPDAPPKVTPLVISALNASGQRETRRGLEVMVDVAAETPDPELQVLAKRLLDEQFRQRAEEAQGTIVLFVFSQPQIAAPGAKLTRHYRVVYLFEDGIWQQPKKREAPPASPEGKL